MVSDWDVPSADEVTKRARMLPWQERGFVQRPAQRPGLLLLLRPSSTFALLPSGNLITSPKLGHRIAQRLDQMSAQLEPPGRGRSAQVDAGPSVSSHETTRRIVTGHDENGKAIFISDEVLKTASPHTEDMSPPEGTVPGFTLIHRADGFPTTSVNDPVTEWHGKRIPLSNPGSTVCRVVDFPPIGENGDAFMHRTQSVDFGVVLKGSIKLILDDGLEKTMSEGDVVVQRGTIHAWKNVSQENCKVLFVLVPAEPVKVEKTGETLRETANTRELHED